MKQRRGILPRLGILLLNLLAPGLGLLRLGRWKAALAVYSVSLFVLLFFNVAPPLPFVALLAVAAAGLATYAMSMWLSWRFSRAVPLERPWYARWYCITGAVVLAVAISFLLTDPERLRYRTFYLPSEGMAPTLLKNDRMIAYMRVPRELRRGDVVLVPFGEGHIYVKRVAAIGGDRIAVRGGKVILNGSPVPQQHLRIEEIEGEFEITNARRLSEQFPDEIVPHQVYDLGQSLGDEMDETLISSGHVFLMGDNRDRSADSRFPREMWGLGGEVPITTIIGRPLYYGWGSSHPMGTPLSR